MTSSHNLSDCTVITNNKFESKEQPVVLLGVRFMLFCNLFIITSECQVSVTKTVSRQTLENMIS